MGTLLLQIRRVPQLNSNLGIGSRLPGAVVAQFIGLFLPDESGNYEIRGESYPVHGSTVLRQAQDRAYHEWSPYPNPRPLSLRLM